MIQKNITICTNNIIDFMIWERIRKFKEEPARANAPITRTNTKQMAMHLSKTTAMTSVKKDVLKCERKLV